MPPAEESGSSVAQRGRRTKDTGGGGRGDGTTDAAVDGSGSSSICAGAIAASTSGGGGSVDGDERLGQDVWQSPGGGGDGSGNPLNSLTGGSVDFDEHSNGPKTDVATGEHGLLPDEVAAVGGGVDAKGDSQLTGSVALGGSSSMVMADIPKERNNQGGAAGAWHVWNASGPQCLSLRVLCISMPPADESGSSVAGSAAKDIGGGGRGDGTSDAAVDESGISSSFAGAFAASTSGGGGSVDGDERQLPCGGGGGSGNPLNCDDVATGEHGLLPDVVAAVGSGVDAKGGSVALGGSSSMGMADKINASSESTTITAAASNICRRGTRSSSGPPGEPARDDGLVEGGRKAVTMSDLGSSTGTPSGVSTTSLGDEIKASSESTNITAAASTINAPGRRGSRRSSGLDEGGRKAVDDSGSGGGSFNNLGGAKGSWHV